MRGVMNNCPRCRSLLNLTSTSCPSCGLDLELLKAVELLEGELAQTRRGVQDGMNRLDRQVAEVRRKCHAALAVVAPVAASEPTAAAVPQVEKIVLPKAAAVSLPVQTPATPWAGPERTAPQAKASDNSSRSNAGGSGAFSEAQFGQKWLLIVGVIVLVLGLGFLLKYSFDQNWIRPPLRVASVYAVGAILLGLGAWFRRNYENFGLCLAGGALATFYFATFAAYQIYDLFPAQGAYPVMVVVTVLAGVLSLKYDSKWLAVLGLVGGFFTPVIIHTDSNNHIALFSYLAVLNAGVLGIAFYKQWRLLNYLGFFFTWGFYCVWGGIEMSSYAARSEHLVSALFFANLFYLIYAVTPFGLLLRGVNPERLQGFGLCVPNSALGFGWSYYWVNEHISLQAVSAVTLGYAAIHLALAGWVYLQNRENRNAMLISLGTALIYVALTGPVLFSHQWITIFWSLLAVLALWIALRVRDGWTLTGAVLLMGLVVVWLFSFDYMDVNFDLVAFEFHGGYTEHLAERFAAAVFVLGALGLSARVLLREPEKIFDDQKVWGVAYAAVFGVVLFALLNIEVGGFFHDYAKNAQFASISVLWALYSVALMGLGFVKKLEAVRYTAMGLFVLTLFKVFFIDMANVSTPFRIISFIVLGVLMIGASFLYYKFRDRLLDSRQEK
jgi:uncharacterized membrane protein